MNRDVAGLVLVSLLKTVLLQAYSLVMSHPGFGDRRQSSSSVVKEPSGSRIPVLWSDLHHPVQPDPPWEDLQDCVQGKSLCRVWDLYLVILLCLYSLAEFLPQQCINALLDKCYSVPSCICSSCGATFSNVNLMWLQTVRIRHSEVLES